MQTKKLKDSPMKLTFVTDSREGVMYSGCRAEGVYKGRRIERTAWIETSHMSPESMEDMETIARGRYGYEMKAIDKI